MSSTAFSPLLALPSELRNQIYIEALAPTGILSLTRTARKRFATSPILGPALLCANRQIRSEAGEILYAKNIVCFSVNASETSWPTIAEARLPQHVLEKLQHLFVVLDCTSPLYYASSIEGIDWTPFSALVSLRTLRVAVLRVSRPRQSIERSTIPPSEQLRLLRGILERVPANVEVERGTLPGSAERAFTEEEIAARQLGLPNGHVAVEAEMEGDLIMTDDLFSVEKGSKSGGVEDVFAEYRDGSELKFKVADMAL